MKGRCCQGETLLHLKYAPYERPEERLQQWKQLLSYSENLEKQSQARERQ